MELRKADTITRWIVLGLAFFIAALIGLIVYQPTVQSPAPSTDNQESSDSTSLNNAPEDNQPTVDQELTSLLSSWAAEHDGEYGVVVRELNGAQRMASYQADKEFVTASTYKLFLIYAVLSEAQTEQPLLEAPVADTTVKECIEGLLIHSSEDCSWELGDMIGWENIDEFLHEQGFTDTTLNNYDQTGGYNNDKWSTPSDEAELMRRLASGTLLNPRYSDFILSLMKQQVWRERIPAGVPEAAVVADKPGWVYDYENDSAIVYGEHSTYVLVIMTENAKITDLAELSSAIYQYLNKE